MSSLEQPPGEPLALFSHWFEAAVRSEPLNPDAAALATIAGDGMPSVRMVLIKKVNERGFVFYTNMASRKGHELSANGKAALCFYWKSCGRQVRIHGRVAALGDSEADAYFADRPRDSQIGAWASKQSDTLASRAELDQAVAHLEAEYAGKEVPRPPFWSGFRLEVEDMEFWEERSSRLHHRLVYERDGADWRTRMLYP